MKKIREKAQSHPQHQSSKNHNSSLCCSASSASHPRWLGVLLTQEEKHLHALHIQKNIYIYIFRLFTSCQAPHPIVFWKTEAKLVGIHFHKTVQRKTMWAKPVTEGHLPAGWVSPCGKQHPSHHQAWLHLVCSTEGKSKHISSKACQLQKTNIFQATMHSISMTWMFGDEGATPVHVKRNKGDRRHSQSICHRSIEGAEQMSRSPDAFA